MVKINQSHYFSATPRIQVFFYNTENINRNKNTARSTYRRVLAQVIQEGDCMDSFLIYSTWE